MIFMDEFKIYNMGGSCCDRRIIEENGKNIFIKEIRKDVEGIDNGYNKFYYEIQHMKKYNATGLYPKIIFEVDKEELYSVGMEYLYNGATLSDLLRNDFIEMDYFYRSFDYIMETLFKGMYTERKEAILEDYLNQAYFGRVKERILRIEEEKMIREFGFSENLANMIYNGCYINSIYYKPLFEYIDYLRKDEKLIVFVN